METEISFYLLLADLEVLEQVAKPRVLVEAHLDRMEQNKVSFMLLQPEVEHKTDRD